MLAQLQTLLEREEREEEGENSQMTSTEVKKLTCLLCCRGDVIDVAMVILCPRSSPVTWNRTRVETVCRQRASRAGGEEGGEREQKREERSVLFFSSV